MKLSRASWALMVWMTVTGQLFAHPGHGPVEENSVLHYALSPTHLLPIILAAVIVGAICFMLRTKRARNANTKHEPRAKSF